MSTSLILQYLVVALAVVFSAWAVLNKQFPGSVRRLRVVVAIPLVREGRPAWLRAFGRSIAPARATAAPGCGGCDNCGPEPHA